MQKGKATIGYLEAKNDIIQFSTKAIKNLNYLNLFQKRYQEKD
jgi:hypothetical protein